MTSVKNMSSRTYDKTLAFLQKVRPDYIHVVQDEDAASDTITAAATTASSSSKKGVRTTTISSDYDMEIVVKHVKRV